MIYACKCITFYFYYFLYYYYCILLPIIISHTVTNFLPILFLHIQLFTASGSSSNASIQSALYHKYREQASYLRVLPTIAQIASRKKAMQATAKRMGGCVDVCSYAGFKEWANGNQVASTLFINLLIY